MTKFPTRAQVAVLRETYTKGTRVELVRMEDPYTKLRPGDRGFVTGVDDSGSVHISWDSGSSLAAIWGVDEIRIIS